MVIRASCLRANNFTITSQYFCHNILNLKLEIYYYKGNEHNNFTDNIMHPHFNSNDIIIYIKFGREKIPILNLPFTFQQKHFIFTTVETCDRLGNEIREIKMKLEKKYIISSTFPRKDENYHEYPRMQIKFLYQYLLNYFLGDWD
ncbi:hypothetical protein ACJX0J_016739 [Zea mays]